MWELSLITEKFDIFSEGMEYTGEHNMKFVQFFETPEWGAYQ